MQREVGSSNISPMARRPNHYLLVVGNREALEWVLREQRMAFPPERNRLSASLDSPDRLLLYTTRGCFNNPGRDRGRIIGAAVVMSATYALESPINFGGRSFTTGCDIEISHLAPFGEGPELAPLVPGLESVPNSWATFMRRALAPISGSDYQMLFEKLHGTSSHPEHARASYLALAKPTTKVNREPDAL
jgi:hypothetical protein